MARKLAIYMYGKNLSDPADLQVLFGQLRTYYIIMERRYGMVYYSMLVSPCCDTPCMSFMHIDLVLNVYISIHVYTHIAEVYIYIYPICIYNYMSSLGLEKQKQVSV